MSKTQKAGTINTSYSHLAQINNKPLEQLVVIIVNEHMVKTVLSLTVNTASNEKSIMDAIQRVANWTRERLSKKKENMCIGSSQPTKQI